MVLLQGSGRLVRSSYGETSLGWVSQSTVWGYFPGSPRAESTAGLAWVGNVTFLSRASLCLNFEIVLSGFQQNVLSERVSASKCHSLQDLLWVSVVLL